MLTPEQVMPFLLDEDPVLRDAAVMYFHDSNDVGPLTADTIWAAYDRFEAREGRWRVFSLLSGVPHTPASLDRLLRELGQEKDLDRNTRYQQIVGDVGFDLLQAHQEKILAAPGLLPHVRDHLLSRLALVDTPVETVWEQLMNWGQSLQNAYFDEFDDRVADRHIEALSRRPEVWVERAVELLKDTSIQDWRECFAIEALGEARYEPAIMLLLEKLHEDADVVSEAVVTALVSIGTPSVVQAIESYVPGQPWHVRLYADDPLEHIKRPESEAALVRLLEGETDEEIQVHMLSALCGLGSLAGIEHVRRLMESDPDDLEVRDLAGLTAAVARIGGESIPEQKQWYAVAQELERKTTQLLREDFAADLLGNTTPHYWRETGIPRDPAANDKVKVADLLALAPAKESLRQDREAAQIETYRREAPKVGRNDPCPCGSGKKYKKCCGK